MIIGLNDKGCDTFNTPQFLFDQLNSIFSFTHDAACSSDNAKLPDGFAWDKGFDGLRASWDDKRIFCNPPFSQKKEWILKAHKEVQTNNCPVCVMILPVNCMSTETFFNVVIKKAYMYEILKKRVEFLDDKTKQRVSGNNSGTVVVYFKRDLMSKATKEK